MDENWRARSIAHHSKRRLMRSPGRTDIESYSALNTFQSHHNQEENAKRERKSPMGTRMGRLQEVPRLARRSSRLGNISPTLLGRAITSMDLREVRRTYSDRLKSRTRQTRPTPPQRVRTPQKWRRQNTDQMQMRGKRKERT